jgi:hypothetical protein
VLEVPRSTLRAYQERLDARPAVVAFFHSVPGLAFIAWFWRYTWSLLRWAPVGFAWCVCS